MDGSSSGVRHSASEPKRRVKARQSLLSTHNASKRRAKGVIGRQSDPKLTMVQAEQLRMSSAKTTGKSG